MQSDIVSLAIRSTRWIVLCAPLAGQSVQVQEIGPPVSASILPRSSITNSPGAVAAVYSSAKPPCYQVWEERVGTRVLTFPAGTVLGAGGLSLCLFRYTTFERLP